MDNKGLSIELETFFEKFLTVLSRIGFDPYVSSSLVILLLYIIIQTSLYLITGVCTLRLESIFILRDIIACLILPPLYLFMISEIKRLPQKIYLHIDLNKDELLKQFENNLKPAFDNRYFVLFGIIFAIFYLILLINYLSTGFYSYTFFIQRLVGVVGTFIVGGIFYQAVLLLRYFTKKVSKIPLKISSLYGGLKPIASLASLASVAWVIAITIIMMPIFYLGFNPKSYLWYIFFYGTLYSIGLWIFILLMYGFHKSMVITKTRYLDTFTELVNIRFTAVKDSFVENRSIDELSEWLTFLSAYEKIYSGKEWPFELSALRDIIFSYIIPIATYLFSLL